MRTIDKKTITNAVARLIVEASEKLTPDVIRALKKAERAEKKPRAKRVLAAILENARVARRERVPICQDTGLAVIFCELGNEVRIKGGTLEEAIQEGIRKGSRIGHLRQSVVHHPIKRKNTGTNSPGVVHIKTVRGNRLRLSVILKGFGCENKSGVHMLNPTAGVEGIKKVVLDFVKKAGPDACPPFTIGVGIGGTMEKASLLAKEALLEPIGKRDRNPILAKLERELLGEINKLGIGPLGFGGKTTALDVKLEAYPTHIAGLPVAVNISCHAHRHASATL